MSMRLDRVALFVCRPEIGVAVIPGESPWNDVLDFPCLGAGYPAFADVAAVAGGIENALAIFAGEALAGGHMAHPTCELREQSPISKDFPAQPCVDERNRVAQQRDPAPDIPL
jgi:hypothetical protein